MTDAVKLSNLKYPDLQGDKSRRGQTRRHGGGPRGIAPSDHSNHRNPPPAKTEQE
jgi:hypothetical protein